MVYMKGMVSSKPWQPIFNVRTRPPLVQTFAFDFLKHLKFLRSGNVTLPSIDNISLPSDRQFVVAFGDLDSVCDCIEFIINSCGRVSAAYGGPDDRGALWIEFYKVRKQRPFQGTRPDNLQKLPEGSIPSEQLQFVIWINSLRGPSIAFDDVKTVKQRMASPTRALEASLRGYQPLRFMERKQRKATRRLVKKRTAGEKLKHGAKRQ